jgi:hypothetical protein
MSAAATIPLRSYDPSWEIRWEDANKVFEHWRAIASAQNPWADEHSRAIEAMGKAGREMQLAYTAQFRTVEEYREWRLKWLWNSHAWPWFRIPEMPDGLAMKEVKHRLDEAKKWLISLRALPPSGLKPEHILHVHHILASPADSDARASADLVRAAGGDRV